MNMENKIKTLIVIMCLTTLLTACYFMMPKDTFLTTKYQVFTIKGGTFDLDVTVLITEDVAFATKYVRENLDSTVTAKDFDARAVSFPTNEGKSPIIWMATTEDKGVIAHEIFHTALNVLYWAGMELNSETEEAFAYEVQRLTDSFYNQINITK
jgi:hypothetical protein